MLYNRDKSKLRRALKIKIYAWSCRVCFKKKNKKKKFPLILDYHFIVVTETSSDISSSNAGTRYRNADLIIYNVIALAAISDRE